MPQILPNDSSIIRTATDALLAKYSAVVAAGYSPNFKIQTCSENGDDLSECEQSDNMSTFRTLLRSMTEYYTVGSSNRQTPLVNAGYAIRISCVLRQVEAFVAFHRHCGTNCPVQILIPGCGLDVTGLWCSSLLPDVKDGVVTPSFAIHVVEIDFPSICESKGQALRKTQGLDQAEADAFLQTYAHCAYSSSKENFRYALVSANLEDAILMDEIFSDSTLFDTNLPTLVVSELVLAYISVEHRETLLRRFASLFQCRGNCTILYEPLGPALQSNTRSSVAPLSVLESYKSSYCKLFDAKLQKGLVHKQQQDKGFPEEISTRNDSSRNSFYPLGVSTDDVDQRLLSLGFEVVQTSFAGRVASSIKSCDWKAKELFDEHAALTLHLCSYVVVCAFPNASGKSAENVDNGLFELFMCPWMSTAGLIQCPIPMRLPIPSTLDIPNSTIPNGWITVIEKEDEKQIRRLFGDTYKILSDEHLSIRKMVKTALRKDLGSSGGDEAVKFDAKDCRRVSSIIGTRYQELGGDFIVAVQYIRLRDPVSSSDGDVSESTDQFVRQILGAIGIRRCTEEESRARSLPPNSICYEIHRLFVDTKSRARGIGTALLHQILGAIRRRHCHGSGKSCYVIATTPTVLSTATNFYSKQVFDVQNECEIGGLTMRTYMRKL